MNRLIHSLCIFPFWLGAALMVMPCDARADTYNFEAREQSARTFFSELSGSLGKPVIVSKAAAAKRISGTFDLLKPQRTFERVASQMGLIWYSDGQAIYLYDAPEIKSSMVSLQTLTVTRLQAFLERSGLHDVRYPLRHDGLRTFHVSGPPMYVDLVVQAAGLMDNQRSELLLGKQQIGVIQVRNTFVSDRKYELRDDKVTIPGLATVIEDLLRGEKREVESSIAQAPAPRPPGLMPAFPLEGLATTPSDQDPAAPRIIARDVAAGNIRVVAYPDTNSLLVKGLPEQVRFIENLVSALDTPKRHVELSLWIIDLHKDELNQLGINWQGAVNSGGKFSASLNAGSATTLDGASFVTQVMALERTNRANVVSRPVILTQENVPAIFDNNRTFYAPLVGERSVDLQHVTYGTLVSVLPRFAQADEVEMSLNIEDGNEVESPGRGEQPGTLPTVGRTRISTVARVPQGKSLLVGGFTRDDNSEQIGQIPVLGSIPWIGRLFSYRQNRSANTVRVFLIQPKEILAALEPGSAEPATQLLTPQQHERVRRSYFRAANK
ncbi:EscC/YscC/HrcC family type III secretion system outer membrane ring protein [Pseudomonas sp. PCH199]|uniref:type III secretion system outer membrane ring subunit SctC n=1 Tax=unclassified Pseudomonas TaxID=196821 RepID=UPI000BC92192|nr:MULTISPECIES: type III secretion system outer membrane ring subunit SctC [unclassified Pseudomonas]MCW8276869.1 EscC/YscC/HrcC family type III secretion system outer membrane ring protein [Pseudomonas sp. PCH199]PAM83149.1 EscC/YscC/HrcC family type III secretion system outer membrane ring protein [Pseudomonas sp. ERMR1:02]